MKHRNRRCQYAFASDRRGRPTCTVFGTTEIKKTSQAGLNLRKVRSSWSATKIRPVSLKRLYCGTMRVGWYCAKRMQAQPMVPHIHAPSNNMHSLHDSGNVAFPPNNAVCAHMPDFFGESVSQQAIIIEKREQLIRPGKIGSSALGIDHRYRKCV